MTHILGSHLSIAGGFDRAVERAAAVGADCLQIFSKNSNQWRAKPIKLDDVRRFQEAMSDAGLTHPIIHDSYLINLASPDDLLWKKSIDAFREELERAELLGVPYVVAHPGAYTSSDEVAGIARIVDALDEIHDALPDAGVKCLLETTAGQGTNLGRRFEELAAILDGVRDGERLDVCFDTCHVFAAGYDMRTEKAYEQAMAEFDRLIGVKRIKAFHLNDSKRELGSRVDRHAHIGEGELGIEAFRHLMNDRRFEAVPMYLETPKPKPEPGEDEWDIVNLRKLRALVG